MRAKHDGKGRPSRRRRAALAALSGLGLIGLCAPEARAEVLAFSTNAAPQLFGANQALVDLATAPGAQTSLQFTTARAGLVEITLSAECAVDGTASQYGTIDLRINAAGPGPIVPIAPTVGTDDAFCSGNAVPGILDGFVMPSVTTVIRVPAGTHALQVLARTVNGANQLRLDDLSISVDN